jgi:hypothetical protein
VTADSDSTPPKAGSIHLVDEVLYTLTGEVVERVAIDFPLEDPSFEALKAQAGADTNDEFVRIAMCWYAILLNRLEEGFRIVIVKDGEAKEVDIRF